MSEWFLNGANGPEGPLSEETLREWLQAGSITVEWYAWREGMPEWKRIDELRELNLRDAATIDVAAPGNPAPLAASPPPVEEPLNFDRIKVIAPAKSRWRGLALVAALVTAIVGALGFAAWNYYSVPEPNFEQTVRPVTQTDRQDSPPVHADSTLESPIPIIVTDSPEIQITSDSAVTMTDTITETRNPNDSLIYFDEVAASSTPVTVGNGPVIPFDSPARWAWAPGSGIQVAGNRVTLPQGARAMILYRTRPGPNAIWEFTVDLESLGADGQRTGSSGISLNTSGGSFGFNIGKSSNVSLMMSFKGDASRRKAVVVRIPVSRLGVRKSREQIEFLAYNDRARAWVLVRKFVLNETPLGGERVNLNIFSPGSRAVWRDFRWTESSALSAGGRMNADTSPLIY